MSVSVESPAAPRIVTLREAFRFWLKLGFISFGGPAGQVAVMHRELVERKRWISEGRFLHALNYCMLLPGPEATQLAIYIGWLLHGTAGGVIAGVLFVLPGALILVGLSWAYVTLGKLPVAAGILYGFKAAVVALVLTAILRIGKRAVRGIFPACVAAAAFALTAFASVPFPLLVLGAGLLGMLIERLAPGAFKAPAHSKPKPDSHTDTGRAEAPLPILLDDHSPTPPHAQLRWARLAMIAIVFAALLALPLAGLALWRGYDDVFARMGRFFTLAAFVTIGGAYAVLPYVTEMATKTYGWLKSGQMMDGLALGETTPGPLILVLTFVGFVGGWNTQHAQMGPAGALCGAAVATYFTFVPSFMFILLGGPFVERTRGELRLGAIMSAITCAVVGVIANLAVLFGGHVLFPTTTRRPDFVALVLIVAACLALEWKKWDVVAVVLSFGAIGVALMLAGLSPA